MGRVLCVSLCTYLWILSEVSLEDVVLVGQLVSEHLRVANVSSSAHSVWFLVMEGNLDTKMDCAVHTTQ